MKIGWLADQIGYIGGAEISGSMLVNHAPDWAEIEFCPANRRPPDDIDLWMLQNVVTYDARWCEVLFGAPIIKEFRDPWHPGDPIFRRFVLDTAGLLIYNSKLARDRCPWYQGQPTAIVPPPVDLEVFRDAALPDEQRSGNLFVGRIDFAKGVHRAIDWALGTGESLDIYGTGEFGWGRDLPQRIRFHGPQAYTRMPLLFGQAKRFVFLPGAYESYSRTTVEAWAAGCELILDQDKIGAIEWLRENPQAIEMDAAIGAFWNTVSGVL